jgi:SET family sugar efflux transporter-like MFS transporter
MNQQPPVRDIQRTPAPARDTALRLVVSTPLYRGATIALFLSGIGFSAAAPQIASFLVHQLGASLTVAGLYYLTNLTAPIAGYLVGARSDRTGSRLTLFRLCAVIGAGGWAAIAVAPRLWLPFVISALLLGFAGAATSQLFAAIHDQAALQPHPHQDGVVAIVRMALTAGWVLGPVAGSFLAALAGPRVMFLATAAATLAQLLPLGGLRDPGSTPLVSRRPAPRTTRPDIRAMLPLLAFTALYICVYAGEPVKYAYLPIYMTSQLHFTPALAGAVIGIQPLVELALMPVAVVVARRTGPMRVMVLGAGFGVAANLCFAFTATAAGLFTGQVLMGGVWGVFATLGIVVAQRLLPTAVATASAIFISSTALSSALGGLTGGLGAAWAGLPLVFLVPAAFALAAVVGLTGMARAQRHPR